jgi:hypothetical protein
VYADSAAITWSTTWTVRELVKFFEHARDGGTKASFAHRIVDRVTNVGRPRVPTVRVPANLNALVMRSGGTSTAESCADLITGLSRDGDDVGFVRVEIDGAALVWTKQAVLHAWTGPTLGLIVDAPTHVEYLQLLLEYSATASVRKFVDEIVLAASS